MAGHTVTVDVPTEIYDQLQRRAAQARRSIEAEVVLALAEAIPGGEELTEDFTAQLASLDVLDDDTLWRLARSRVSEDDHARLAELGDRRQQGVLTATELQEAKTLATRHDRALVTRAEAAALLKRRGHAVDLLRTGA